MSKRYDKTFEYLNNQGIDEIVSVDWEDKKLRLESDFNKHIDECVAYGDYTAEQGEDYKRVHRIGLWGVNLTGDVA